MKDKIKEILDKFDKVLENYELDKKFGQISVDSICHLFPSEMVTIRNCITNLQKENKQLKERIDKAIDNCKKSIECINQKLQDDKTIKVIDGKVVNMNEYQIVRLKAIRMKCKELLEILGDKE